MLEPRRLLSTSPVYDFDAAANTGTPAQGVTVSWAQGLKPAAPQTRVMLANLPAHAMVYADVDFKATAVGTHSVDTAGRTSQQTVDANGTVARSGIDGWVADANGTLTITVGGDAQSLAGLHVYAYDPTVSLTADGTLYRDGDPVTLTGTRDLPGTFADITKSEPVPDLTVQLADNGGTAQPGTDYTLSPPSLNFTAARVSDTTLVNPAGGSGATTAETIDLVAQIDDRLLATSGITVLASKPTGLGHAGSEPGVSKSNPLKLDANPGRGVYRHVKITDSSGGVTGGGTNDFSYKFRNGKGKTVTGNPFVVTSDGQDAHGISAFGIRNPTFLAPGAGPYEIIITIKGTSTSISIWVTF